MKKVMLAVLMASFILAWPSPGLAAEAESAGDSTYYTRVGFSYWKGVHQTTNYMVGTRVPINTEVEVIKRKTNTVDIRIVGTGETVKIKNVKNFSGEDMDGIFDRMFSRDATDLSAYSPEQVTSIEAGNFEPGMTKDEIILSIGYPPKHQTPSLDQTSWRYWRSKWDTVLLFYKGDVLDRIQD